MGCQIGEQWVGLKAEPFIIAELSGNHNQSLERALAIVDAVAEAGAHAIKLQTFTPDTMTLNLNEREFLIQDANSLWRGENLYSLYEKAYTPWEWHPILFKRAKEKGLLAFSTPFDSSAVDFLESLDVPAYKIASFENGDLPLIRSVASTGKPVIISTGLASIAEIDEAVNTARQAGCHQLILLKCTSNYPASAASSNLNTIPHLRALFNCDVGLSDHTLGIGVAIASVAVGSVVIEKHVTLDRSEGGVDAAFSLEPHELKQLVQETKAAWQAMGGVHIGPTTEEEASRVFRRTLYICDDLKAGEQLTQENLRAIRPGLGLAPKFIDQLLGKRVNQAVKRGTSMSWDLIS